MFSRDTILSNKIRHPANYYLCASDEGDMTACSRPSRVRPGGKDTGRTNPGAVYMSLTKWRANSRPDDALRPLSRRHPSGDLEDGRSCTKRAGAAPIDNLVP
jgi:hypothetical protein